MTLREGVAGKTYKVKRLNGDGAIKRRLMDMGFTNGCEFSVRKVAPLGDPVEINIRGYELSVRRDDAQMIEVLDATSHPCSDVDFEDRRFI